MNERAARILVVLGSVVASLLVVAVVVLLTDGGPAGEAAATSTLEGETTVATSTTLGGTTTTTSAVTTSTAARCTAEIVPALPPPGPGVSAVSGDFDADGLADQLLAYQAEDGTGRLQMVLSYGFVAEAETPGPARALATQAFTPEGPSLGMAIVDDGRLRSRSASSCSRTAASSRFRFGTPESPGSPVADS